MFESPEKWCLKFCMKDAMPILLKVLLFQSSRYGNPPDNTLPYFISDSGSRVSGFQWDIIFFRILLFIRTNKWSIKTFLLKQIARKVAVTNMKKRLLHTDESMAFSYLIRCVGNIHVSTLESIILKELFRKNACMVCTL